MAGWRLMKVQECDETFGNWEREIDSEVLASKFIECFRYRSYGAQDIMESVLLQSCRSSGALYNIESAKRYLIKIGY